MSSVLLVGVAFAAAITDLWKGRIYNALTYPAALLGLAVGFYHGGLEGLGWSALGFTIAIVGTLPLFALRAMGGGDVKLFAAIGAIAGPWGLLLTFVVSMLIGAVLGIALLAWKGELVASCWSILAVLWTAIMPGVKTSRPRTSTKLKIRFGLPIALATVVAVMWIDYGYRFGLAGLL